MLLENVVITYLGNLHSEEFTNHIPMHCLNASWMHAAGNVVSTLLENVVIMHLVMHIHRNLRTTYIPMHYLVHNAYCWEGGLHIV